MNRLDPFEGLKILLGGEIEFSSPALKTAFISYLGLSTGGEGTTQNWSMINGKPSYAYTAMLSSGGNDETGTVGDLGLPFYTAQAAWDAGARILIIRSGFADAAGIVAEIPIVLTLIGFGRDVSTLTLIKSHMGVTLTGNGMRMVNVDLVDASAIDTNESGNDVTVNGCRVTEIVTDGADGTELPGGDGGNVFLREAHVVSSISRAGGESTGGDGDPGELVATYSILGSDDDGSFQCCLVEGEFRSDGLAASAYRTLTGTSTFTVSCISWLKEQNVKFTLSQNATLVFTGVENGMSGTIDVRASGAYTLTLPAGSMTRDENLVIPIPTTGKTVLCWTHNGAEFTFTSGDFA
ncbi:MAG: hypothetical protein V4710_19680 [Verrucomicrobiota bacterium]